MTRYSCRQFHDQSALAAATLVTMAEFGLLQFDPSKPGQELVIHGLIQHGLYQGNRGVSLSQACLYMRRLGLAVALRHDSKRSLAVRDRLRLFEPDAEYYLASDLGAQASPPLNLRADLQDEARLILVQVQMWNAQLAFHPLLLRAEQEKLFLMNPFTGADRDIPHQDLWMHMSAPVHAGPRQFAGGMYIHTGLALRVCAGSEGARFGL